MKAAKLQEGGKTAEAEALYRKILKSNPADFVSRYSLGVISFAKNDYQTALDLFEAAKKINPAFAQLWYNIGLTLGRLGRFQEAVTHLEQCITLDPSYDAAIRQRDSIVTVLAQSSDNPTGITAQNNTEKISRAFELQAQGDVDEASKLFLEVLANNPSDLVSLYSLGVLEQGRNNAIKALAYFDSGLAIKPDYAPLWYNRGIVLQSLKQHDKAVESYDKSLALNPAYIEAMVNRGAALVELKRHKDALLNYEDLLKVDPNNDKALCNRGIILTDFKLNDLAIQTFERLLQITPDYDYALGLLSFAKLHACSWDNLEKYNELIVEGVRAGKRVCKSQGFLAISNEPRDHLLCAQIFASQYYPVQEPMWRGKIYDHKKIRIAYVSPDFREHPVGHLTAGIFENHDKDKFETIAISLGIEDNSRLRERMVAAFDRFIDVRQMSSRDVAAMMLELEVDIAVDLGGYTADTRTDIFAHRPAPIQINYLGYSSTMGVDYIDYIIADRLIIPEDLQDCYSEKVVYLPDAYLPTDSSVKIAECTPPREEYGLPAEGVVFCSFNHDYKINPPIFDVWMRLLKQVPGSVLWLMKLNESAERNLLKEAEARGVDSSRIIFATRVPKIEDHLARYRLADLFLDTTPYNAHTTTSDVLRAGLPVLTCMGKAFAGRVAGSLLHAVGLPEMVTNSLEEYEALALQLAREPDTLKGIKEKLKRNLSSSPLYDTGTYCRNLEAAYTGLWEHYQQGLLPISLGGVLTGSEGHQTCHEPRRLKVALEKSRNLIYDRIVEELVVGFRKCGHECIVIDPAVVTSKVELLVQYNQCDWVIITNSSGLLSLKWPQVHLFEEITAKVVFLHHDAPFNTRVLNDIQEKLDAFMRIKDRSVHFTVEKSDAEDFRRLGLTAHIVSHINTLGFVPSESEPVCQRDVAFIGHAVPPFWSPVLFGTEHDNDYFNSYLSRVTSLDHHIKNDFNRLKGIDSLCDVQTTADISLKMQYIQHVHLYSQPHRGAVLEKVCGHDLHIYGGDPSWVHGIEQSRFLNNANITYHKPVFERDQVIDIFSTSKINVNITSLQFDTAVINRVMDCAAAGGFILTDRKDQLYELTSVADEISYRTIDELNYKIDYFMQPENQKLREEIRRQLRRELEARCVVDNIVEYMISAVLSTAPL